MADGEIGATLPRATTLEIDRNRVFGHDVVGVKVRSTNYAHQLSHAHEVPVDCVRTVGARCIQSIHQRGRSTRAGDARGLGREAGEFVAAAGRSASAGPARPSSCSPRAPTGAGGRAAAHRAGGRAGRRAGAGHRRGPVRGGVRARHSRTGRADRAAALARPGPGGPGTVVVGCGPTSTAGRWPTPGWPGRCRTAGRGGADDGRGGAAIELAGPAARPRPGAGIG